MLPTPKPLWGEGLFLRPHHFQQQDAYHEARLQQIATALHPCAWGLRQLRLDEASLTTGTVRVLQASAIFPDGEVYSAPDADDLPPPLTLGTLPDDSTTATVHLALPLLNANGRNCAREDDDVATRFIHTDSAAYDLFTGSGEAPVPTLRRRPRLLLDSQPRDAYTSLPLCRVRRGPSGQFELDTGFMTPALGVQASAALLGQLRRLIDSLHAKSEALQSMHREPSKDIVEFRSGDVASFWLLHTVNSAAASLAHLLHLPGLHPERLHQELLRLAGGLATFSRGTRAGDLPQYRHADPGPGFSQLDTVIRELLDTVISARFFAIALEETKPAHHLARLDSEKVDETTALYLGVSADMPANELTAVVPVRFKVGAPDDVEKCVLAALPGVKLVHCTQVPAAIPVRPGSQYFSLEPRGALYERMLKARSAMVYVPAGLNDLKLELLAVTR